VFVNVVKLLVMLYRLNDAGLSAAPTRPAPRECTAEEFRCDDGTCIEQRHRCDREYHCPDGTDEFHCCT